MPVPVRQRSRCVLRQIKAGCLPLFSATATIKLVTQTGRPFNNVDMTIGQRVKCTRIYANTRGHVRRILRLGPLGHRFHFWLVSSPGIMPSIRLRAPPTYQPMRFQTAPRLGGFRLPVSSASSSSVSRTSPADTTFSLSSSATSNSRTP